MEEQIKQVEQSRQKAESAMANLKKIDYDDSYCPICGSGDYSTHKIHLCRICYIKLNKN